MNPLKTTNNQHLIAIDLDGTLLTDHKGLDTDRLIKVTEKLKHQNTHVIACTGNTVERARLHLNEAWGAVEYMICDNGGVVTAYNPTQEHNHNVRVLFKQTINPEDVNRLADTLTGKGNFSNGITPGNHVAVILNTDTHSYMVAETQHIAEAAQKAYYTHKNQPVPEHETPLDYFNNIYPGITYTTWNDVRTHHAGTITKFALNTAEYNNITPIVDTLISNSTLPGGRTHVEFAPSGYGAIAVTPKNINKGTGIRNLLLHSKISAAAKQLRANPNNLTRFIDKDGYIRIPGVTITAIGDEYNDTPMFAYADTAVAMGNAKDGVKEQADIILPGTNNDGAVLDYLEELASPTIY